MKQLSAEGQQGGAAAVGEETEVADADKGAGQQVEKEAAQELIEHQFEYGHVATQGSEIAEEQRIIPTVEERFRERAGNHPQHLLRFDQRPLTDIFTVQPGQIEKRARINKL
jgi:hypothetical protein